MAVYCFICGRRRVAVARYQMICLVPAFTDVNEHDAFDEEDDGLSEWMSSRCHIGESL